MNSKSLRSVIFFLCSTLMSVAVWADASLPVAPVSPALSPEVCVHGNSLLTVHQAQFNLTRASQWIEDSGKKDAICLYVGAVKAGADSLTSLTRLMPRFPADPISGALEDLEHRSRMAVLYCTAENDQKTYRGNVDLLRDNLNSAGVAAGRLEQMLRAGCPE